MFDLPPWYFQQQQQQQQSDNNRHHRSLSTSSAQTTSSSTTRVNDDNDDDKNMTDDTTANGNTNESILMTLPSELLHHCFISYGTYGTFAKLACIQSSWKHILYDTVQNNIQNQYILACSMIHGNYQYGLLQNQKIAIRLLQQMTNVDIDPITQMPQLCSDINTSSIMNDTAKMTHNNIKDKINGTTIHNMRPPPLSTSSLSSKEGADNNNHDVDKNRHKNDKQDVTDETLYATKAMKRLADLYLKELPSEIQNDDGSETTDATSSTSTTTPTNAMIGLQWLKCAYHIGNDIDAAYEIATIYERGNYTIPVNIQNAIYYFYQAAIHNHVDAMIELALCYEIGCNTIIEINHDISFYWYYKAATYGNNSTAQYCIGEIYECIYKNITLACMWYYQAAMDGDDDSILALRRLYDIARIVIPGITQTIQQISLLNDENADNDEHDDDVGCDDNDIDDNEIAVVDFDENLEKGLLLLND